MHSWINEFRDGDKTNSTCALLVATNFALLYDPHSEMEKWHWIAQISDATAWQNIQEIRMAEFSSHFNFLLFRRAIEKIGSQPRKLASWLSAEFNFGTTYCKGSRLVEPHVTVAYISNVLPSLSSRGTVARYCSPWRRTPRSGGCREGAPAADGARRLSACVCSCFGLLLSWGPIFRHCD